MLPNCKIFVCIIVYRLHVTITYQIRPAHVQLNSNILIHMHRNHHQCAIQIIHTVAPKDQHIHQPLSAKVLQALAVTTIQLTVHRPLARVLVTTVTVQPLLVACHMALLIAIIHTVSKIYQNNLKISSSKYIVKLQLILSLRIYTLSQLQKRKQTK